MRSCVKPRFKRVDHSEVNTCLPSAAEHGAEHGLTFLHTDTTTYFSTGAFLLLSTMALVQQHILETLTATSQSLSEHVTASNKLFESVSATREARLAQLLLLQQDLRYIFEALTRMQRSCDNARADTMVLASTASQDT